MMTTLSDDILKQVGMLGMAECYFMERAYHPADIGAAYQLYESLLNMPNLPDRLKQTCRRECLRLASQLSNEPISNLFNKFSFLQITGSNTPPHFDNEINSTPGGNIARATRLK
jgi:hypothetical protein